MSAYLLGKAGRERKSDSAEPRLTGETDLVAHHGLQRLFAVAASNAAAGTHHPGHAMDRTYLGYVKDLPGKNSCLTDKTLRDLIARPPTGNNVAVKNFDADVLNSAFTLQPGPVTGFTAEDLGADDLARSIEESKRDSSHTSITIPRKISVISSNAGATMNGTGSGSGRVKPTTNSSALPQPQSHQPPTKIKLKLGISGLSSNNSHQSSHNAPVVGLAGISNHQSSSGSGASPYINLGEYSGDTEKKKKKKRRHDDDDGEGVDDGNGEPKKKKKKKKHSHHEMEPAGKVENPEEDFIDIL